MEELDTLIKLTNRRKGTADYPKLLERIRAFRESGEWTVTTIPPADPREVRHTDLRE